MMHFNHMEKKCGLVLLLCVASTPLIAADTTEHHDHPVPEKLGAVTFPTSCQPAAQPKFERAMALLHSFAYSASDKAFRDVIAADPKCAIAHWGLAMSYVHPLWEPHIGRGRVAKGQQAIQQAERLGGSERERGFIDALESSTRMPDLYRTRNALRLIQAQWPNWPSAIRTMWNARCFMRSRSCLFHRLPTKPMRRTRKQRISWSRCSRNSPQHPGIAHYLIHACDNSEMATRGVEAARLYAADRAVGTACTAHAVRISTPG